MDKWKKALDEFLKDWENEDFFEGAIACGSMIAGNADEFSDIDVHIIFKRDHPWRERGNKLVKGYLIEYFGNPVNKYEDYFAKELNERGRHTVTMFSKGISVRDRTGEVAKLQEKAREYSKVEYPNLTEYNLLMSKYSCWDKMDELKSSYYNSRDNFYLIYYDLYQKLVTFLGGIRNIKDYPFTKLDKIIDNETFRNNYGVTKFYDDKESSMIRDCMNMEDKEVMFNKISEFYDYVIKCSGGFDINEFVLRSDVK